MRESFVQQTLNPNLTQTDFSWISDLPKINGF